MPVTTIATATLIKALARPAQDIYELGKGRVQTELEYLKNEQSLKHVAKCLRKIDKVKTFWSDNKEVSLLSFYYPSRIVSDGHVASKVDSLADLPTGHCYVVQGTVGQGKSIFLRYLASKELRRGSDLRIPIFAELRFLQANEDLEKFLFDAFEAAGLKISSELFAVYANSGRIVLFLDAFDELDPTLVARTIRSLDRLIGMYPQLQIVISARPDSDIQRAPSFRVINLAPLSRRDHKPFLEKLTGNQAQAEKMLKAIQSSSSSIDSLLTTPLLLTLLMMLYAAHQHIPDTVSEFYAELFDVLFYKHDRTKSGFKRKRHVDVSDSKIKKMFEGLCFFSVLKGYRSFRGDQFGECVEQASRSSLVEANVQGFRDELVKTACLLKEEGPELSFIHKSVQEFYSAAFVAGSNDDFAKQFYEMLRTPQSRRSWHQQLAFLKEIDEWRYAKFFWLPSVDVMSTELHISGSELYSSDYRLTREQISDLMDGMEVGFLVEAKNADGVQVFGENAAELDDEEIFIGNIDWDISSYSEGPLFSRNAPLQGIFTALCVPLRGGWMDHFERSKMKALADAIEEAAERYIRSSSNSSLMFDGLDIRLVTFEDGAFAAEFDLRKLLEYAGGMDEAEASVNEALAELVHERNRLLEVVAAEEQKASMLKLLVGVAS